MTTDHHGLSIGIERVDSEFFLAMKAVGKLTHQDYEVITPLIESALHGVKEPVVNVLIDGTELRGWELRAAWDDLKLGLSHNKEFKKIAIFGNSNWQEIVSKIGGWFASGEVKYFNSRYEAVTWLFG